MVQGHEYQEMGIIGRHLGDNLPVICVFGRKPENAGMLYFIGNFIMKILTTYIFFHDVLSTHICSSKNVSNSIDSLGTYSVNAGIYR